MKFKTVELKTDVLIIGGGTAGCACAIKLKEINPKINIVIMEKSHIDRSGCLAQGVSALNAYIGKNQTPEKYLEYVKNDSHGLVRDDLILTAANRFNETAHDLEKWGLPIIRDAAGNYENRGPRSIRIYGERIKPIIAAKLKTFNVTILNRVYLTDLIKRTDLISGAIGVSVREEIIYKIYSRCTVITTGGASGIYKPNNSCPLEHKMWYSPYNVGSGYASGFRAGSELTTLEMRFIALRVKDILAPTGTIFHNARAPHINAKGEGYLSKYCGMKIPTTALRAYSTFKENYDGFGPCAFDTRGISEEVKEKIITAYFNMCPPAALYFLSKVRDISKNPVEIFLSEPYIVGGHAAAGFWIDEDRKTTINNLYACGDAAGGMPKKYVTGCMAEAYIAAENISRTLDSFPEIDVSEKDENDTQTLIENWYRDKNDYFNPGGLERFMQKIMDEYAGGQSSGYLVSAERLKIAYEQMENLSDKINYIKIENLHQLMHAFELRDKIFISKVLIKHLDYRKETRWPLYQTRIDYPESDDFRWKCFINSYMDKGDIKIREVMYK